MRKLLLCVPLFIIFTSFASADLVSTSHLGYHPDSSKYAIVYTSANTGSVNLKDASTNQVLDTFPLRKARDYEGNNVNCQGNNPCLVADFSSFPQQGEFYIDSQFGRSNDFKIRNNLFKQKTSVLLEFYNAQLQQNSAYHADLHSGHDPEFTSIADGSFLMEADQAALTLIRLGSAYRRNPAIFNTDKHDVIAPDKPDMQEYIISYSEYLKGLQGVEIEELDINHPDFEEGFRLSRSIEITNAFVPGPTELEEIDVYIPGNPPTLLRTVPVVSLCGEDDGSNQWNQCTNRAARFYKCQIDEPCLNVTYIEETGRVSGRSGFGVSRGWDYEFGCYIDINVSRGLFNDDYNPCLIFREEEGRDYTSEALLAYLEALPALNDYDPEIAQEYFERAVSTKEYIDDNFPPFQNNAPDAGFYGAALFLLYDYTQDPSYLAEAHSMRNKISTNIISDRTRGEEFYWEEYVMHKQAITSNGLQYQYNNVNPEEFFRGKMFFDWKDRGELSMSENAERVFLFDPNIQFQNSRFILTEGLLAVKTQELHDNPEDFIKIIGDNQISWILGMNGVQDGVSHGSPIVSKSFIFGIGKFPKKYHSRYLLDSGYSTATNGQILGTRGTNYQFFDGNEYIYFDGKFNLLGKEFGSDGNGYEGEDRAPKFKSGIKFLNGKRHIPGWINGAFDTVSDNDVIFNYHDNVNVYEYTETTNEIVATAVEYFAYYDGMYNNRPRHENIVFGNGTDFTPPIISNGQPSGELSEGTRSVVMSVDTNEDAVCRYSDQAGQGFFSMTRFTETGERFHSSEITGLEDGEEYDFYVKCRDDARNINPNDYEISFSVGNGGGECYDQVQDIPAECSGGTITEDFQDWCRHITCESGGNSLRVLTCNKPGDHNPEYFEMYKETQTGSGVEICLAGYCINDNSGFQRSDDFPICV